MSRRTAPFVLAAGLALAVVPTTSAQEPAEGRVKFSWAAVRSPESPVFAFRLQFGAGSIDDPAGKEGLAALTARMVGESSTTARSYDAVLDELYPWAASIGTQVDKEVTVVVGRTHRDHLDPFLGLMAEMLTRPAFETADFERHRDDLIDYVSRQLPGNDDEELGKQALQRTLYAGHPYGHPVQGTVEGLRSITLDDVRAFYERHYRVSNLTVGMGGRLDQHLLTRVMRALMVLPKGPAPGRPALPEPRAIDGTQVVLVDKDSTATAVSIGFPIDLTRADADFAALAVAASYLGEHRTFNGLLMQKIRGQRGLNYGDYAYAENFIQEGGSTFPVPNIPRRQQHFSIWLRPIPHDKAHFATRLALRELRLLQTRGLTAEQLDATREFLINYSNLWAQTLDRRVGYELDSRFYGRTNYVAELQAALAELTVEDVNRVLREHLEWKNLVIAMVTPDPEALREALLADGLSPLTYDAGTKPESVLAEDGLVQAYPLWLEPDAVRIVPAASLFER